MPHLLYINHIGIHQKCGSSIRWQLLPSDASSHKRDRPRPEVPPISRGSPVREKDLTAGLGEEFSLDIPLHRAFFRSRRFATSDIAPHNCLMTTWLIDMGYITKASKNRFKLDYVKARQWIERKLQDRCQAIIFNSVDKRWGVDRGLVQFYHTIQQAGFIVNLYQMEGGAQKQVDVAIAATAVYKATQGHTIVLSSGDLDFLPAATLITQQIRSKLILFTYNFGFHDDLSKEASEHWMFEDHHELERIS
jgi:uncharacterized LabA/DUF88 family protein